LLAATEPKTITRGRPCRRGEATDDLFEELFIYVHDSHHTSDVDIFAIHIHGCGRSPGAARRQPAPAAARYRLAELVKNGPFLPILLSSMATPTQSRSLRGAAGCRLLGVSANTVRRWADSGRITCQRSPSDQRRFLADDLEALVAGAARRDGPQPRPGGAEQRYSCCSRPALSSPPAWNRSRSAVGGATPERGPRHPDCDIYRQEDDERMVCVASSADGVYNESWVGQEFRLKTGPATGLPSSRGGPSPCAASTTRE